MAAPAFNTVTWFEVATDDPDSAQRFYGELFGWRFAGDAEVAGAGMDYRLITYPGEQGPSGGLFGTRGEMPNHGIFTVAVEDVSATCDRVEALGGKVLSKVVGSTAGPDFACLHDNSGILFGIFKPTG